ncbi:membrane protein [Lampropedia cohaerens]|uniref:Membrane protein n=1 Tax=Lampropedia cohaerens TaxID=1610491 RepID=A0A0U1Q2X6_9BURK|nr:YitT family protein [Lampropedia cohaerens]KKW69099.1 membrane protein [Lampropedia cohaerens]
MSLRASLQWVRRPRDPQRHGYYEDFQALFAGTLFVSLTLMLFAQAGLLTGSTAGVAFLIHYWTGWPLGAVFFAINLPFYWFSWQRMGAEFTFKTFIAVGMLALLTDLGPKVIHVDYLNPLFAAILGGLLLSTGCLFLARHRASLGGATIVSLYLQEARGIPAGKVQLFIDCTVVLLALFIVPFDRVLYSIVAAVVMGVFLWLNHRPGRYVGR